jgi:diguanylate cyclase (GGDEF)-like protein
LQPVAGPGSATGFIEIDLPQPPDKQRMALIGGLVAAFRNIMGLLDYSEVDTLTGLLNRKTFDEHLIHILSSLTADDDLDSDASRLPKRRRCSMEPGSHWLAVLDIDHFKRINDNFGHMIGDEVLLLVANLMKNTFRFRDKLFRFGGEEFVVVLNPTNAENAFAIFDRFRQTMADQTFPQVGKVTISIGFAPIRLHDQPSVILDNADQALYWSKEHGRNQVSAYEVLIAENKLQPQPAADSDIELF